MSSSGFAAEAGSRFAAAMEEAGGWEARPRVAIGLSGGPDSLALAILSKAWADARGGDAVALVLDHGLRPASRIEARLALAWARALGLEAIPLRLPPVRGGAASLRAARLAALVAAAREAGAVHLLLAHHRADQAETVLLRAMRGSREHGLAAIPPVRPAGPVRLLRPLLDATPAMLKALLRAAGQPWVEDPSNAAGARGAIRHALADRAGEGVATAALAEAARLHRQARASREAAAASLLARAASVPSAGVVTVDDAALAAAPPSIGAAAVLAVLRRLGGRDHAPRGADAARVNALLAARRTFTLGGCVIAFRDGAWRVMRERRGDKAVAEGPGVLYSSRP